MQRASIAVRTIAPIADQDWNTLSANLERMKADLENVHELMRTGSVAAMSWREIWNTVIAANNDGTNSLEKQAKALEFEVFQLGQLVAIHRLAAEGQWRDATTIKPAGDDALKNMEIETALLEAKVRALGMAAAAGAAYGRRRAHQAPGRRDRAWARRPARPE
jgi:hypothetical protein